MHNPLKGLKESKICMVHIQTLGLGLVIGKQGFKFRIFQGPKIKIISLYHESHYLFFKEFGCFKILGCCTF
jgi:hypothetical protein